MTGSINTLSACLGALVLSLACIAGAAAGTTAAGGTAAGTATAVADADDVVAIVSNKSPVAVLTKAQIADIFMANAPQLPYGVRLVPIDQLENSAARDRFYVRFADRSPAQMKLHWSKVVFTGRGQPPKEASSSIEARKMVASDPNAIGYIEKNMLDDSVRALKLP